VYTLQLLSFILHLYLSHILRQVESLLCDLLEKKLFLHLFLASDLSISAGRHVVYQPYIKMSMAGMAMSGSGLDAAEAGMFLPGNTSLSKTYWYILVAVIGFGALINLFQWLLVRFR
jgi:hypothetical protein